jgi:hypothetical protein
MGINSLIESQSFHRIRPRYPFGKLQFQTRPCSASDVSIGDF